MKQGAGAQSARIRGILHGFTHDEGFVSSGGDHFTSTNLTMTHRGAVRVFVTFIANVNTFPLDLHVPKRSLRYSYRVRRGEIYPRNNVCSSSDGANGESSLVPLALFVRSPSEAATVCNIRLSIASSACFCPQDLGNSTVSCFFCVSLCVVIVNVAEQNSQTD